MANKEAEKQKKLDDTLYGEKKEEEEPEDKKHIKKGPFGRKKK